MSTRAAFGIIGIGTMGSNLALNVAEHGFPVALWDLDRARTEAFVADHTKHALTSAPDLDALVAALARPRRILLMVPAGRPVEESIAGLAPRLDSEDVIIDGGNSNFKDTRRRAAALAERELRFFGLGVSGGSEGARHGPSLMPGGPEEAYWRIRDVLESIAARGEGGPCVSYLGPDGAGHFVKTVHNGIEYADLQAIAEAYDVLKRGLGLSTRELADTFDLWNRGALESFLLEVAAGIFTVVDRESGDALVEQILDVAEQKGTGRWTAITALELGVPAPSIVAAVDARILSSRRSERLEASRSLHGPAGGALEASEREPLTTAVRDALYASRACALAQGMDLIRAGSAEYGWDIPRAEVARIWTAGCIIRSRFLSLVRGAFEHRADLPNLLLDGEVGERIETAQAGWRRAVAAALRLGIPTPCWSASLAYYDAYRTARLPQNLTQAQRDWFGAHTYRRLDDPRGESVHTDWAAAARSDDQRRRA